jgi:hypothetical protein
MRRSLAARVNALLLTIAFVSGGFGLATVDALVFHAGHRSEAADGPHFDPPGGCGAHSEHCALVLSASLRQLPGAAGTADRFTAAEHEDRVLAPVLAPRSADSTNLHPARAPPTATS